MQHLSFKNYYLKLFGFHPCNWGE